MEEPPFPVLSSRSISRPCPLVFNLVDARFPDTSMATSSAAITNSPDATSPLINTSSASSSIPYVDAAYHPVNHSTAHLTQPTSSTMAMIPSDFFGGRRSSLYDPFSTTGGRRTSIFDPFSLDLWDPLLDFSFTPSTALSAPRSDVSREVTQFASARVDWRETPDAHIFQVDLPGMRKDEVRVDIEDGRVLSISGERVREKEEATDTWHRSERGSGRFSRRFRLPMDARVDQVKATMENGVLTVVVPKVEAAVARPDVKPIPIAG